MGRALTRQLRKGQNMKQRRRTSAEAQLASEVKRLSDALESQEKRIGEHVCLVQELEMALQTERRAFKTLLLKYETSQRLDWIFREQQKAGMTP